jgi:hypothetical protein
LRVLGKRSPCARTASVRSAPVKYRAIQPTGHLPRFPSALVAQIIDVLMKGTSDWRAWNPIGVLRANFDNAKQGPLGKRLDLVLSRLHQVVAISQWIADCIRDS